MSKTLNVQIKNREDTSANWTHNNPILLSGEIGIENDTGKIKVGNGTSNWNSLSYEIGTKVPENAKFTDTIYTLPTATSSVLGGVKTGLNITNSSGTISITKSNVTSALGYTPPTTDTTYSDMVGATSSSSGIHGLVPAPIAGTSTRYLRSDGIWQTPPDTNTTYNDATTSQHGLMTSEMVTKLNGIATGANAYVLPTASTTLGGVKTTSSVGSSSGYTACPIISGVPYYKDTDTTYSAITTEQINSLFN